MHTLGRRILLALVALLVLLLALFAAAPVVLAWVLERQVSAATGRDFSVAGPLQIDWGWRPVLVARRPRLANAAWAEPAALFAAEHILVQLDLPALLRGRVRLPRLEVESPRLHLARDAEGRVNWDFPREDPSDGGPPEIQAIEVRNGRLSYRDARGGADLAARVEAHAPPPGAADGGPRVQAQGEVSGRPFALRIDGQAPLARLLAAEQAYPLQLHARAGEARLALAGEVAPALRDLGLDLRLEFEGPDLGQVLAWFGLEAPETAAFSLQGRIHGAAPRWQVAGLRAALGGSDLAGALALDTSGGRPSLTGRLDAERMDLRDLEGLLGKAPREPDPALLPRTEVPVAALHAAEADLELHFAEVTVPGVPVEAIEARVRLQGGQLRLQPLHVDLAGGAVDGRLLLDAAGDLPRLNADLSLRRIQLGRFFPRSEEAVDESRGGIHGQLIFEGAGPTVAGLVENSAGKLTAFMSGGRLDIFLVELLGIDVVETLGAVLGAEDEANTIRCAVAALVIEDGVVRPDPLVIDTQDSLVVAAGTVDFPGERLDLRLEAHPKDFSLIEAQTPVAITGPLRAPEIEVDKSGIAARAGAALALGALAAPLAAILPFVEPGLAENADCNALFEQARQAGPGGEKGGRR